MCNPCEGFVFIRAGQGRAAAPLLTFNFNSGDVPMAESKRPPGTVRAVTVIEITHSCRHTTTVRDGQLTHEELMRRAKEVCPDCAELMK